ncbi:MAG: ABC transporter ATP-binding protein [Propionibacteriaceae bacterium]|nr:ABC transporter ATP-binding protein [Propionibacteriaceae bacterium]
MSSGDYFISSQAQRRKELLVNHASKTFTSAEGTAVRALDDVTLSVGLGEFFVMLGPSGCGKTTLLRSIAGLEVLDKGEIYLGDLALNPLPPYRRPVNTVFQSYALFPHLSVYENIAFGLRMDKMPRRLINARVYEMLELVQLADVGGRKPNQLSGGQQQRVALARALAKSPKVLLLDEPLSALDLKLRRGMQGELKRIQRETGITFVFVTHDQEEALSLGDQIAVFENGKPAQIGTPQEIYKHPVNRFVADFIGDTNFLDSTLDRGIVDIGAVPFQVESDHRGGKVTLAVRPENIFVTPNGKLAGTLTEFTYMGTDLRATVALSDGQTLRLRISPPFPELRPGGEVRLDIPPDAIAVVD